MQSTVDNPIPGISRLVRHPALIVSGLLLLLFLALPWGLEHKAHMVLHGLCAQRPSHTYMLGDRALPFDARMTGIYLGYLVTSIALITAGAHRWCKPPSLSRIALLLALGGIMLVDGFNSLLKDLGLPFPYEPRNWLRVATGMTAGMVLAVALCFLISSSLWKQVDTRRQTLHSLRPLVLAAIALGPLGVLVGSGWEILFAPFAVILIAAALLALSSLALVLIVIGTRRDFSFDSAHDLGSIGTVALAAGVVTMLALSIGRSLLESVTGPSTLT